MGTRVAGAVAVLALVAGATLGVGAWRSYQADEKQEKVKLAAEEAAAHKELPTSPSPLPPRSTEPKVTKEATTGAGTGIQGPAPDPVVTPSDSAKKDRTEEQAEDVAEAELRTLTAGSRTLLLKNVFTGLCADIPYYKAGTKGEDVNQYHCDGTDKDNQLWRMTSPRPGAGPGGTDLVQFANMKDGLCMDLPTRGSQPAGTVLLEAVCTGTMGDNQLWWFEPAGDGSVMIRNFASNHLCLKVDGSGAEKMEPARQLAIGPCGSREDSRWQLID